VLVLGGTGRVGSAAAAHLLAESAEPVHVTLAGRSVATAAATQQELLAELGGAEALAARGRRLDVVQLDFEDGAALREALRGVDAVLHTAGPYLGKHPDVLRAAIECRVPVYADLSDPLEYLEEALELGDAARAASTRAIVCAGAFPGLSNVLAVECAARLGSAVRNLKFSYFTAGGKGLCWKGEGSGGVGGRRLRVV